jgi:putative transposase
MAKRLAASMRTRQNLSELIEGRLSSSDGRSDLVKLAARLIIEEALEEESRDALGRDYYERGGDPDRGYRNGVREGRLKTAEGMIPFPAPPPRKAGFAGAPSQRSPTAKSRFAPKSVSI